MARGVDTFIKRGRGPMYVFDKTQIFLYFAIEAVQVAIWGTPFFVFGPGMVCARQLRLLSEVNDFSVI